jgi:hypothetical protein
LPAPARCSPAAQSTPEFSLQRNEAMDSSPEARREIIALYHDETLLNSTIPRFYSQLSR